MPSLSDAESIVTRVAPDLPRFGVAFVVAIAMLEGDFSPHHNWGAITAGGNWTGATFEHADSRWTPTGVVHYVTQFRDYPDDDSAALGLVQLLRSRYGSALNAAVNGHWFDASKELYDKGYYTGVKPRAAAIADHYRAISKWLIAQGIHPAIIGAAFGLEALFWVGLAVFGWRAARRVRR